MLSTPHVQLPVWLQASVLRAVQHSTATLDVLAHDITLWHDRNCALGEPVTMEIGGKVCVCVCCCVLRVAVARETY
jgi:hypothetical protein